jgi:hypothetical protein
MIRQFSFFEISGGAIVATFSVSTNHVAAATTNRPDGTDWLEWTGEPSPDRATKYVEVIEDVPTLLDRPAITPPPGGTGSPWSATWDVPEGGVVTVYLVDPESGDRTLAQTIVSTGQVTVELAQDDDWEWCIEHELPWPYQEVPLVRGIYSNED